jgi:hypothetical protein
MLNSEANAIFANSVVKARLAELGETVLGGTPSQYEALIAEETEKWAKVVRVSGAKPDWPTVTASVERSVDPLRRQTRANCERSTLAMGFCQDNRPRDRLLHPRYFRIADDLRQRVIWVLIRSLQARSLAR